MPFTITDEMRDQAIKVVIDKCGFFWMGTEACEKWKESHRQCNGCPSSGACSMYADKIIEFQTFPPVKKG